MEILNKNSNYLHIFFILKFKDISICNFSIKS